MDTIILMAILAVLIKMAFRKPIDPLLGRIQGASQEMRRREKYWNQRSAEEAPGSEEEMEANFCIGKYHEAAEQLDAILVGTQK